MAGILSNGLSFRCLGWKLLADANAGGASTRPSQPTDMSSPVLEALGAVGTLVLLVWVVRRIAYPRKLLLGDAPGRANQLNPLHLIGVFLLYQLSFAVVAQLAPARWDLVDVQRFALGQAVAAPVLIAASLSVGHFAFRGGLRRGLGLSARRWLTDSVRAGLAYLGVLPVCMALLALSELLMPSSWTRQHPVLEAIHRQSVAWQAVLAYGTVVLAPLAEEIFFRGLLQSMLRRYLAGPWPAVIAASALFAFIHAPLWQTIPALFALGLVLGYSYERTGRLFAPIAIHALFNAVSLGVNLFAGT